MHNISAALQRIFSATTSYKVASIENSMTNMFCFFFFLPIFFSMTLACSVWRKNYFPIFNFLYCFNVSSIFFFLHGKIWSLKIYMFVFQYTSYSIPNSYIHVFIISIHLSMNIFECRSQRYKLIEHYYYYILFSNLIVNSHQ